MNAMHRRSIARMLGSAGSVAALFVLALAFACVPETMAQQQDSAWQSVLPAELDSVRADAGGNLPSYDIAASLDFGERKLPATIEGKLRLTVPPGVQPEDAVYLRLYANDPGYGDGSTTIERVTVNGELVTPALSANDTVAMLAAVGAPGQARVVEVEFTTRAPVHSRHGFGMFSVNPEQRQLVLAHWYPMLAGVGPSGADLAPPSQIGDPVFSGPALYSVTIDAPADLVLITGGVTLQRDEVDGRQTTRFAGGPAREFPLVAAANLQPFTVQAGKVAVTSWAPAELRTGSERVAGWAAGAIESFNRRFGAYPFRELDLVAMELHGAAGMEFPGLVLISPSTYAGEDGDRRFGEMVVAHEVAHQWWYGTVLNDQSQDAFIDEGISEYIAAKVYFEDLYGLAEGQRQFELLVGEWMDAQLAAGGDVAVDIPTEAFPDRVTYAAAVYAKASLAFDAIRQYVGDDAFFAALRQLALARRFDVIGPEDVEAAFVDACGCEIDPLWSAWFEEKRMAPVSPPGTPDAAQASGG